MTSTRIAGALISGIAAVTFTAAQSAPGPEVVLQGDPLGKLAGEWRLSVFVMGGGEFGGLQCGASDRPGPPLVTVAPPNGGAVSLSVSCEGGRDYTFRLSQDSTTHAYAVTVNSPPPGISVQDLPVAYAESEGWQGKRDEQVDGQTQSITAMIAPIEGRNWYGWMIAVLPTSGVGRENDLRKPFLRADLTRRK